MRRIIITGLVMLGVTLLAGVVFAADDIPAGRAAILQYAVLGAGLAIGLGAIGSGVGMGTAIGACIEGTARNPEVGGRLMTTMIIGLAMIESLTIYALVIAIVLLFVRPGVSL